ncbi:hypothetical protein Tco_0065885 [Tanacetum coccineum]
MYVKINGDVVESKTVRKNSFRPPVIEDCNSDDDSESNPQDNTKRSTMKKGVYCDSGCSKVKATLQKSNAILLSMKIMMVDLFPLEMVKVEFELQLLRKFLTSEVLFEGWLMCLDNNS